MSFLELTDKDFNRFKKIVYEKCGISLHDGKRELVRARVAKRLRETGNKNFDGYHRFLINDNSGDELIEFINAISTNLTSFFRELQHFEFLEQKLFPKFQKKNKAAKAFQLWSAGCSSGEEPYSLAICFNEFFSKGSSAGINILATDISTKVLSKAMSGVYQKDSLTNISNPLIRKYFQKGQDKWEGCVRLKPVIRNMIEFRRLNLMEPFPFKEVFDAIFCRNVMIYFDKSFQEILVNKYYECLKPDGYLFIGHSESLTGINHKYKYIQPALYRK